MHTLICDVVKPQANFTICQVDIDQLVARGLQRSEKRFAKVTVKGVYPHFLVRGRSSNDGFLGYLLCSLCELFRCKIA
jgi:hypothetical protein